MKRIGRPLQDLLARLDLTDPMVGWRAVELWPQVVGERVAAKARAVSFHEGNLLVEVDTAAWMNELTYLRDRIAKDLNAQLGGEVVRAIRLTPARSGARPPEHRERTEDS